MKNLLPKTLLFLRHGIAEEPETWVGSDSDRPLTKEGQKRTRDVAMGFLQHFVPTVVISSPYVRANETADIVLDAMKAMALKAPKRHQTPALEPGGSYANWVKFLGKFKDALDSDDELLVVGHEPSLSSLICGHLGLPHPLGPLKKAGLAVVRPHTLAAGDLVAYLPPKIAKGLGS